MLGVLRENMSLFPSNQYASRFCPLVHISGTPGLYISVVHRSIFELRLEHIPVMTAFPAFFAVLAKSQIPEEHLSCSRVPSENFSQLKCGTWFQYLGCGTWDKKWDIWASVICLNSTLGNLTSSSNLTHHRNNKKTHIRCSHTPSESYAKLTV